MKIISDPEKLRNKLLQIIKLFRDKIDLIFSGYTLCTIAVNKNLVDLGSPEELSPQHYHL